jgi:hypothetical protein
MMMIRSTDLVLIAIIFHEVVIVLSELLNSCTQLLTNILLASILLARNQHLLSPNPYLRISMFLALLYVMGLATAMSIQLGPSHTSPNIIQLMCSYLSCISEYLPTDVLHT